MAMQQAAHTLARVGPSGVSGAVQVFRSDTGRLHPDRGPAWWAVGDAVMGGDPLAGNGVGRALNSAIALAEEVDAQLSSGRQQNPQASFHGTKFTDYLAQRSSYYHSEPRWPESVFWARRRPKDWRSVPITLDPMEPLKLGAAASSKLALAPAEALAPYRAISQVLKSLEASLPAHRVVGALRDAAPLDDRLLLVAVQELVDRGALARGGDERREA
jgi:hypothetical protein